MSQHQFKQSKQSKEEASFINNRSFYRSDRALLDSRTHSQLMKRLSRIFDLVTLHCPLPSQLEVLLKDPLSTLRTVLSTSRRQIANHMLQFKDGCSKIFEASPADTDLLLRTELSQNNRWASESQAFSRKENERDARQQYFSGLKMKFQAGKGDEGRRVSELEVRLDSFWCQSRRKVYL